MLYQNYMSAIDLSTASHNFRRYMEELVKKNGLSRCHACDLSEIIYKALYTYQPNTRSYEHVNSPHAANARTGGSILGRRARWGRGSRGGCKRRGQAKPLKTLMADLFEGHPGREFLLLEDDCYQFHLDFRQGC